MYQKQAVITGGNGEYNNQQLNKIMLCSKSLHRFHKKRQHKKIKDKNLERQYIEIIDNKHVDIYELSHSSVTHNYIVFYKLTAFTCKCMTNFHIEVHWYIKLLTA